MGLNMLVTSNDYSSIFLEKNRLILDSCVLNDWATKEDTRKILEEAHNLYSFVFCNISILEVGFGPSDKADPEQVKIAKNIYQSDDLIKIDNMELFKRESSNIQEPKKAKFAYNPNHHEWLASRTHLIRLMELKGFGGKKARELSNDVLIYMCAWNSRSSIITNNMRDFELFNESSKHRNPKHMIPIYSLADLEKSFTQNISFPENINT